MGRHQELHPARPRHLLAGEDERHGLGLGRQPLQDGHGPRRRRLGQDPVVDPEAAAEVAAERLQHRLVLVHHQQDRRVHAPHPG
jgi:hypothetical protein